MQAPHRVSGWTLLEALTTLGIGAILTAIAVPSFEQLRLKNIRSNATQELVTLFAYTRSTAVTSSRETTVCGSGDGVTCQKTTPNYFLVFTDKNNNYQADPNELLRVQAVNAAQVHYQITASNHSSFRFKSDGTASSYGNVILCPALANNHYGTQLMVSNMGRVRHARDRNGDGIVEGQDGKPLVCP